MTDVAMAVLVGLGILVVIGDHSWRVRLGTLVVLGMFAFVLWFGQWLPLPLTVAALCYVAIRSARVHWWADRGGDPW